MPQENHHLCQRKCTPMKYYFCLSNVNTQSACHISEFYTGWLTHWGEKNAQTDADFTAAALEKILQKMVLQFSMYVSTSTIIWFGNHILNNHFGLGFLIFRWPMVGQTLDFIMEQILV